MVARVFRSMLESCYVVKHPLILTSIEDRKNSGEFKNTAKIKMKYFLYYVTTGSC